MHNGFTPKFKQRNKTTVPFRTSNQILIFHQLDFSYSIFVWRSMVGWRKQWYTFNNQWYFRNLLIYSIKYQHESMTFDQNVLLREKTLIENQSKSFCAFSSSDKSTKQSKFISSPYFILAKDKIIRSFNRMLDGIYLILILRTKVVEYLTFFINDFLEWRWDTDNFTDRMIQTDHFLLTYLDLDCN